MRTQYARAIDELERSIQDTLKRGYTPEYVKNHWSIIVDNILRKIEEKEQ